MMKQLKMIMCLFVSILALVFLGQVQSMAAEQMDTSQLAYNIEAQSLKSALEIYQKTSGLNLAYSDDLVQGKMTDGVYGKNTTAQALTKILKGTGLTYTITNQGTVVLTGNKLVMAQREVEGKEERLIRLEEIVVTATKTERKLKDIPASVTVINRKEVERQNPKSIVDLFYKVPGVTVRHWGDRGMDELTIRGVGGQMGSRYVEVLVDGYSIKQGAGGFVDWTMMPIESVERIEVVNGPISALYGTQAMGGVVNIITKSGSDVPETEIGASYGSYDAQRYDALTRGKVKDFSYALGFTRTEGDGWRDNSSWEDNVVYGKFGYEIDDVSDVELSVNWVNQEGEYPGYLTYQQYKEDPKQANYPWAYFDIDYRFLIGMTYNRLIGESSKLIIRPYHKSNEAEFADFPIHNKGRCLTYGLESTYEMGLSFFGREHTILFGGQLEWEKDKGELSMVDPVTGAIGATMSDQTHRQFIKGIFLQPELRITDKLIFIPGVRYDGVDWEMDDNLKTPTDLSKDADVSQVSPKVGMVYQVTGDLSLYGNYGQGFKLPYPSLLIYNPDLDTEYATNYEVGAKCALFDKKLNFGISAYYIDMEDEIVMVSWTDPQNVGETSHKGVEVEASLLLPKGFSVFASWGYQEVKYENYEIPAVPWPPTPAVSYKDKYVPHIPKHTASAGIGYVHLSGVTADLTANYVGEKYMDLANSEKLDSYTLFNAKLSIPVWKVILSIAVDNITDEEYSEYAYSDPLWAPDGGYCPLPGRTVTAGLKFRF